jgi:hypothetical protein
MSTADDQSQPNSHAARLAALRRERDEVEASLPKHSVPASMVVRLEELDDQIAALEAALNARDAAYPKD